VSVEIRQVVIRAQVGGETRAGAGASGGATGGQRDRQQQEDLVQDIVDQVMQILRDKDAR